MKKLGLKYKIFFSLNALFLPIFILIGWMSYSIATSILQSYFEESLQKTVTNIESVVKTSTNLSILSFLRSVTEQKILAVTDLHQQSDAGKLQVDEAKEIAANFILAKKIGPSGYCFVLNSMGTVLVHPNKEILQHNVREHDIVKRLIKQRDGFYEYRWKNPGEEKDREKVLYVSYYEPWDWFICSSAYKNELFEIIEPDDFRANLLSIKLGQQVYPFIISENGVLLTPPSLKNNIQSQEQKESETAILNRAIKDYFANGGKTETYYFNNAKIVVIFSNQIKELNWVVGAIGHHSEFFKPLNKLGTLTLIFLVFGVCCTVLVSYYLSRSITAPLKSLIATLSSSSDDLQFDPFEVRNQDEIAEISAYCKSYIEQLNNNNLQLQNLLAAQKQASLDLQIFQKSFENAGEGIIITDDSRRILMVNPSFEKISGYLKEDLIGQNSRIFKSGHHSQEFYEEMWEDINKKGHWSGEIWNKRNNGEKYPGLLTVSAIKDEDDHITHYTAIFKDITTTLHQQEHIEFLAHHDPLTHLPNRFMLLNRLQQMISYCRRTGDGVVCLAIDFDNFKNVNDSMGHPIGDELLKMFVERVKKVVRVEDILARMGGDEFIYAFSSSHAGFDNIPMVIKRFHDCMKEPFLLLNQKIYMTLSIGVAVYPNDSQNRDDLIKRADLALFRAKQQVGNSYQFFSHDMEVTVVKKIHYLSKIRNGLEQHEFLPYYQPKIDLTSGKAIGMEALARWKSDERLINPGDFIPLAEESGLIVPLARQIYQLAFKETAELNTCGYDLNLSVNVAPFQLHHESFLSDLMFLQEQAGLQPHRIELEVTESSLMENVKLSRDVLQQLADLGFQVSIDDFGTGYSSLQYLKQLPINTLKIDMAFISGIGENVNDEILVKTIVLMAKQFGLNIVAEGIENDFQVEFLRNLGCEMGQGYYYGKPMEAGEFKNWLREQV